MSPPSVCNHRGAGGKAIPVRSRPLYCLSVCLNKMRRVVSRLLNLGFALSSQLRFVNCHLSPLATAMFGLCARSASISFLVSLFVAHHVQAQCYLPNGTITTDLYHNRCSNDTSNPLNTICCAVDRAPLPGTYAENEYARDECLDSGICRNRFEDANGRRGVTYWREECTEKDWTSGKCLNVCTDDVSLAYRTLLPAEGRRKIYLNMDHGLICDR